MSKQKVIFQDLGKLGYQQAWDYQESLLQENIKIKSEKRIHESIVIDDNINNPRPEDTSTSTIQLPTFNHLLFVEHPPVYTLGKSGNKENILLNDEQLADKEIGFFHTNRGGDITYHGPGQIVGYPILDLEKFGTDIGKYLRNIEEVVILTLAEYGIRGERSAGETGVWLEPGNILKARKICAIGVRCSRWITMHGFALNVNTDLSYFKHIIPCGISNKQVTSMEKEIGELVNINVVKEKLKSNFEKVFDAEIVEAISHE